MSSTLPTLSSTFNATIGAWIIGAHVSTALLGITTLQCWTYYMRFPKDPLVVRALVVLLWCLEVARTALCVRGGYYYSVEHWGDVPILSRSPYWSLEAMVALTAPIELLAHLFFAHKVRCVTAGKYRFLFYLIVILSVVDFAFGIASYITAVQDDTFEDVIFKLPSHIATGALACAIVVDWTITISLVSFLRKNQNGTRYRTLVQTLISYTINFGLLISLTDLVVLILANVKWPGLNLYQVSTFEAIGNFYTNTVLASLNSRTLIAAHLYRPGNLHFTSINVASTQINGFYHPSGLDEGRYHVTSIRSDSVVGISGGDSHQSNSTESVDRDCVHHGKATNTPLETV